MRARSTAALSTRTPKPRRSCAPSSPSSSRPATGRRKHETSLVGHLDIVEVIADSPDARSDGKYQWDLRREETEVVCYGKLQPADLVGRWGNRLALGSEIERGIFAVLPRSVAQVGAQLRVAITFTNIYDASFNLTGMGARATLPTKPTQPAANTGTLYPIVAQRAQVAVVLRHGPGKWWHVLEWNLRNGKVEHGAWFRGNLYPDRCDISPDGELLYYYALKGGRHVFGEGTWGAIYDGVSKMPWLFALEQGHHDSTYNNGSYFTDRLEPGHSPRWKLPGRRYLYSNPRCMRYPQELRRGWVEHEHCPKRADNDTWDEKRAIILAKRQPEGRARLILFDKGYNRGARGGRAPSYRLERGDEHIALANVRWADWNARGNLLIATNNGELQIRDAQWAELPLLSSVDLKGLTPDPRPAPKSAQRW